MENLRRIENQQNACLNKVRSSSARCIIWKMSTIDKTSKILPCSRGKCQENRNLEENSGETAATTAQFLEYFKPTFP